MQPERVKFSGIEYDVIDIIKLNNGQFLILKNNNDVLCLDMSKINSSFFEVDNPKEATKVENVLMDYIVEAIKNDIRNGKYQSKEDLKRDIVDLNKYINTHPRLLGNMRELDFKDDVVLKTITGLLSYFDDEMKDAPLNLEGITSLKILGEDYKKYKDENNMNKFEHASVKLGVDNNHVLPNNPAVQQQNISNDQERLLTEQPKTNEQLETVSDVKESTNTGNNLAATETNEQPTGMDYQPDNEEVVTQYLINNTSDNIDVNAFVDRYLYDLSVEQIDYLLNNYNLTDEYINKLNNQKNEKNMNPNENQENENNIIPVENQKQFEPPKVRVLAKDSRQPKAAFVDTLLLSFVVGLVSGMYLILLILMIMS